MGSTPTRRWFQFRLRTLFRLIAIVAVLSTMAINMRRAEEERKKLPKELGRIATELRKAEQVMSAP